MAKRKKTRAAKLASRHASKQTSPASSYINSDITTPGVTPQPSPDLDHSTPETLNTTTTITTDSSSTATTTSSSSSPDGTIPPLTLGDRFKLLPAELRAEIFARLLVRRVKWDLEHLPGSQCLEETFRRAKPASLDCWAPCAEEYRYAIPRWWNHAYGYTRWRVHCRLASSTSTTAAAAAARGGRAAAAGGAAGAGAGGKGEGRVGGVAPWHSEWAPEQPNTYLCTECYERKFRNPRESPRRHLRSLPCLCARRDELQVLLVCRQWYDEAGMVFYTRNTFAFGHPDEVLGFVGNLAPRWKKVLSKVSFMLLASGGSGWDQPRSVDDEFQMTSEAELGVGTWKKFGAAWAMLQRELPGLTELEVDAMLLARPETARVLRATNKFANLKKVRFVQGVPEMWWPWADMDKTGRQLHVWPRFWCRRDIGDMDDEFATEVARGMRGWRHGWEKNGSKKMKAVMAGEQARYCDRFVPIGPKRYVDNNDVDAERPVGGQVWWYYHPYWQLGPE